MRPARAGPERVERPHLGDRLSGPRVDLAVGGPLGPVVGAHESGLDQLGEEQGRRLGILAVEPPRSGQQQRAPGARERHIRESPLLGDLVRADVTAQLFAPLVELLLVDGVGHVPGGQLGGVSAQRVRQRPEPGEPTTVAGSVRTGGRGRRQDAVGQSGHGDDVPFEALRRVHGDELDRVRVRLGQGSFQAPLLARRGIEPRQERAERRHVGSIGELHRHVPERVEVRAGPPGAHPRPRGHLDVEPEQPLGLADELGQRQVGVRPQRAQQPRQLAEAVEGGVGELPAGPAVPPARREIIERVHDAALVDDVALEHDIPVVGGGSPVVDGAAHGRPAAGSRRPATRVRELAGPGGQRMQVGDPQPGAGPGEQADQRVAARRVVCRAQGGDQVDDLRGLQQAPQPDDLDRQTHRAQRRLERPELGPLAAQDRRRHGRARGAARAPMVAHEAGHSLGLELDRDRVAAVDHAGARLGASPQPGHLNPGGRAQGRSDVVGGGEDRPVVAPGGRQEPHGRGVRDAVGEHRESVREPLEPTRARPAPAVDRLVWVTDGGDRMSSAEKRRQELELRVRGVLVLVEQHDPKSLAFGHPDRLDLAREPGGDRDLVAEVDDVRDPFAVAVGRHELQEPRPLGEGPEHLGGRGVRSALGPGVRDGEHLVDEGLDLVSRRIGLEQVLCERTREREHGLDDRGRRRVRREVAGPGLDDLRRDLPLAGLTQQPRRRLDAEAQRVVGHDRGRVRVVGRHRRPGEIETDARHRNGLRDRSGNRSGQHRREPAQPQPDPVTELAGRLARERQAEHLLGRDDPVGDEPDDPRGHRLGLARPGAGHDEQRAQGGLDDLDLVGGRRGPAEQVGDAQRGEGHSTTWRPSPCNGQLVRTGHIGHRSLRHAVNSDDAMVLATVSIIVRAQLGASVSGPSPPCARTVGPLEMSPTNTSWAPALRVPSASPSNAPPSTASW